MIDIPRLETDRLVLRAPCAADFEPEAAFFATEASRFVGGPQRPDQTWRMLALFLGHWMLRGYGFWGVEHRQTGDYLGHVGLWYPEGWPEPEVGWTLMTHATGHGFATEAATAARAYAYGVLQWPTAISLILPGNEASMAVARRLGATFETTYDHPGFGTVQIWRHPAPDALADGGMEAYA